MRRIVSVLMSDEIRGGTRRFWGDSIYYLGSSAFAFSHCILGFQVDGIYPGTWSFSRATFLHLGRFSYRILDFESFLYSKAHVAVPRGDYAKGKMVEIRVYIEQSYPFASLKIQLPFLSIHEMPKSGRRPRSR